MRSLSKLTRPAQKAVAHPAPRSPATGGTGAAASCGVARAASRAARERLTVPLGTARMMRTVPLSCFSAGARALGPTGLPVGHYSAGFVRRRALSGWVSKMADGTTCAIAPLTIPALSPSAPVNDADARAQVDVGSQFFVRDRPTTYFRRSGCRCARSPSFFSSPSTHPSLDVASARPLSCRRRRSRSSTPKKTCFSARQVHRSFMRARAARGLSRRRARCARLARRHSVTAA